MHSGHMPIVYKGSRFEGRWLPAINSERCPTRMGPGGVRAWTAGRAEVPEGAEETIVLEKLEKVTPEVPS